MKYLFLCILMTIKILNCMELEKSPQKFVEVYKTDPQRVGKFWVIDEFSMTTSSDEQVELAVVETPKAIEPAHQYFKILSKFYVVFRKLIAI